MVVASDWLRKKSNNDYYVNYFRGHQNSFLRDWKIVLDSIQKIFIPILTFISSVLRMLFQSFTALGGGLICTGPKRLYAHPATVAEVRVLKSPKKKRFRDPIKITHNCAIVLFWFCFQVRFTSYP